jgi:hypothetical protein
MTEGFTDRRECIRCKGVFPEDAFPLRAPIWIMADRTLRRM